MKTWPLGRVTRPSSIIDSARARLEVTNSSTELQTVRSKESSSNGSRSLAEQAEKDTRVDGRSYPVARTCAACTAKLLASIPTTCIGRNTGGRCHRNTESARSTSHVQDSFDSANLLLQKPAGIPAMMINARHFSLDEFVAGTVGNRMAQCGRRTMDILDSRSFPHFFNELRSVRFSHAYPPYDSTAHSVGKLGISGQRASSKAKRTLGRASRRNAALSEEKSCTEIMITGSPKSSISGKEFRIVSSGLIFDFDILTWPL